MTPQNSQFFHNFKRRAGRCNSQPNASEESGEIFAVHEDVDNTLAIGQEITLGFFEKGPVLLPAA